MPCIYSQVKRLPHLKQSRKALQKTQLYVQTALLLDLYHIADHVGEISSWNDNECMKRPMKTCNKFLEHGHIIWKAATGVFLDTERDV
ncbi:hypothetical protein ACRRTK_017301 [Alexandromys fortis]